MSTEENKAIVRRLIEDGWGPGNLDVIGEVLAPSFADSGGHGPEEYKRTCAEAFDGMSSRHYTIHGQIAEGDQVSTHAVVEAIQTGPLMGLPPSNKRFTIDAIVVHRIADGKIVAERQFTDMHSFLMQIGAVPSWEEIVEQAKKKHA